MEYERIDKVQSGISPSKLRMKLMGPHHLRKKDGSNGNSSRTSPSRIEDSEFVNSLLASKNEHFDEQVKVSDESMMDCSLNEQITSHSKESLPGESIEVGRAKSMRFSKIDNGNSSSIHPIRTVEDENPDSDSNASSSSFEFHRGERAVPASMARSYSRPMSSKWNDAEKWILNKQNVQDMNAKKNALQNQANRIPITNMRVAPESANSDHRFNVNGVTDAKTLDFGHPPMQMLSREPREMVRTDIFCSKSPAEDTTVLPTIRSVCMRDMGTEMTPAASQEPSRTSTPVGATTPLRTPTSSVPSTPHRVAPTSTPLNHTTVSDSHHPFDNSKKELSEQDMKLKTRREIVALGVQLGKMNIAAWASKDETGKSMPSVEATNIKELEQIEYEKRAVAWEEAKKSKHTARYKREEIKIQAWESRQRAKLEAEMQRIEAKVEQMRAKAQAHMVKKNAMASQRAEEKRAAAEARKNLDAERTAAQVEYIIRTGRLPSSHFTCCGWV
ncbi:putative Auxin response factor [Hibiscus syriacus]|uniref:Auxin response factor n=1 Tax=Hibiscus syriacus TaxID=106335 RepID=A0A6A2ZWF7_HIBSY|nr:uncharacterized protein LOC120137495 [Hibiscus syriacus]KAE8696331.1 putative Auxin response factor [Hibiscus syriacus]